ncbi:tetratricopeptide repeat protein [Treponema parvum]|uniref:Tetratricopeptide repeat protein n=1 Tax=Treponema parvum TaxID=138851 RepID=A0A975F3N0_9SPIR|nr:tetratricopeptide repeat protein [Treponema parvum]QTQ13757.1 tetratricopeptide repeat protein [Treponema parvum]
MKKANNMRLLFTFVFSFAVSLLPVKGLNAQPERTADVFLPTAPAANAPLLAQADRSGRTSQSASDFYRLGVSRQQSGNYYSAIEAFKQATMLNPTYGDAWLHLSQCAYYLDEFDLALQYADTAAKYAKNDSEIQNLRGMTYISLGNFAQARSIFEKVLSAYPNNIEARFGLAELDLFSGRVGDAENLYKDALKRQGSNRKALLSLALISAEQGKTELTRNYVSQALQYHSGNAEVHFLAAYLDAKAGNFESAEYRVRSSLQIDGSYYAAYELLANILFMRGKYIEAIDVCDFCIDRDRTNGKFWYIKGLSLYRQGKTAQALSVWENALYADPQDEILRAAFELLANETIPLEDKRRAVWAEYHVGKAKAYEKKFQGNAMRFEYQRALKLYPYDTEARTSYAKQLVRDGLYELYLEQLKFIKTGKENAGEIPTSELTDTIEAYESLLQNTLAAKWNIDPLYLDKIRWHLGICYESPPAELQYPESIRIVSELLCDMFSGISAASVDVKPIPVSGYADAFGKARRSGLDYFLILKLNETERELSADAVMYSALSGNEIRSFSVFRTGNDRYSISLRFLRRKILETLPIKGRVLAREGDTLLIDLGKTEGIVSGAEFDVVKKGEIRTANSSAGLSYKPASVIGSATVFAAGEEVSEAAFKQKGFFDNLNIGDEVALIRMPQADPGAESGGNSGAAPASGQGGVSSGSGGGAARGSANRNGAVAASETAPAAAADGRASSAGDASDASEGENELTYESMNLERRPALIELIRNIRNTDQVK